MDQGLDSVAKPSAAIVAAEALRKLSRDFFDGQEAVWKASTEYLPLEQEDASNPVVGEKIEMLEEFERRKRARMINVSTDDSEIKKDLR